MPLVSTSSDDQKEVITGAENRQAWMLIGSAIRMAYGLGLDQVGYYRSGSDAIVDGKTDGWRNGRTTSCNNSLDL
jgi:hypothetical protein